MEYTICNESLVYYALRNPETQRYFNITDEFGSLHSCCKIVSIEAAKEWQKSYPEYSEIRKIKVLDIGEA